MKGWGIYTLKDGRLTPHPLQIFAFSGSIHNPLSFFTRSRRGVVSAARSRDHRCAQRFYLDTMHACIAVCRLHEQLLNSTDYRISGIARTESVIHLDPVPPSLLCPYASYQRLAKL